VAEDVLRPSQASTVYSVKVKRNHSFRRQHAAMCHSRGKLNRPSNSIENFEDVNAIPQLWDLVKCSIVNKLAAPKENPAFGTT
jgi:hypothetical protein